MYGYTEIWTQIYPLDLPLLFRAEPLEPLKNPHTVINTQTLMTRVYTVLSNTEMISACVSTPCCVCVV